jgi:hypothetical protein
VSKAIPIQSSPSTILLLQTPLTSSPSSHVQQTHTILRFPTAIRSLTFVFLAAALLSIPALLSGFRTLATPRKARALFDDSALHDTLFLHSTGCTTPIFLGYTGLLLRKKDGSTDFLELQIWSGVCLAIGTMWLGVLYVVTARKQKRGWRV